VAKKYTRFQYTISHELGAQPLVKPPTYARPPPPLGLNIDNYSNFVLGHGRMGLILFGGTV
jgi:hypothetical protein